MAFDPKGELRVTLPASNCLPSTLSYADIRFNNVLHLTHEGCGVIFPAPRHYKSSENSLQSIAEVLEPETLEDVEQQGSPFATLLSTWASVRQHLSSHFSPASCKPKKESLCIFRSSRYLR